MPLSIAHLNANSMSFSTLTYRCNADGGFASENSGAFATNKEAVLVSSIGNDLASGSICTWVPITTLITPAHVPIS